MTPPQTPRPAPVDLPRVMLLSLWAPAGGAWHARLVDSQATVHEFSSPFELARFLAQPRPREDSAADGLR